MYEVILTVINPCLHIPMTVVYMKDIIAMNIKKAHRPFKLQNFSDLNFQINVLVHVSMMGAVRSVPWESSAVIAESVIQETCVKQVGTITYRNRSI